MNKGYNNFSLVSHVYLFIYPLILFLIWEWELAVPNNGFWFLSAIWVWDLKWIADSTQALITSSLAFKLWSKDQQQHHHLGVYYNCKLVNSHQTHKIRICIFNKMLGELCRECLSRNYLTNCESCYVQLFTSVKKNIYQHSLHSRCLRTLLIEWHHYDLPAGQPSSVFPRGKKDSLPVTSIKCNCAHKQSRMWGTFSYFWFSFF